MTEHCVCAHCKLAEAERKLKVYLQHWLSYVHMRDAVAALAPCVAAYEATLSHDPRDEAAAEKASDARVNLFFQAKAAVTNLPPELPL